MKVNYATCWQQVQPRPPVACWWCGFDGGAEPPGSCQAAGGLDWPQLPPSPRFPVPPFPSPRLMLPPSCHARATVQSVSAVLGPRGTRRQRSFWGHTVDHILLLPADSLPLVAGEAIMRPVCLPVSKCASFERPQASRPRCVGQHARSSTHRGRQPNAAGFLNLSTATCLPKITRNAETVVVLRWISTRANPGADRPPFHAHPTCSDD